MRPKPKPRGLGKPPPPMTREDRRVLDEQRRALDGIGGQVRSQVPTDAYREGWERVFGRKRRSRSLPVFCEHPQYATTFTMAPEKDPTDA